MRKILLACTFVATTFSMHAQSMEFLDINRVKAAFWADGTMFWDKISEPQFEWPKDSGTHVNFMTGLWLGGITPGGTLKGGYMRYGTLGNDYFPGPLTLTIPSGVDSSTMAVYNKVWKVNKTEIDQFRLCHCDDPSHPTCVGYSIPASILDWPGNPVIEADGDHLLMDPQLAPYHDANGNGVYEPNGCDYPLIKCDQSLFYVFNDRGGLHMESYLPSVGLEIRALAYSCSCDSISAIHPALEDAVFLDLEVIHRGQDTLYQTYLGMYTDADIGGAPDDYFGTHVEEGYIYHYNADDYDDDYSGQPGYGSLPPAHALVFLQGPRMDANGIADFWDNNWDPANPPAAALNALNLFSGSSETLTTSAVFGINGTGFDDGIVDNENLGLTRSKYFNTTTDPFIGNALYRAQRAFWDDGSAQTYGGGGYPTSGEPRAFFAFPHDSDPFNWGTAGNAVAFPWSEFNTGGAPNPMPAGDRRSVSASGPFTMMPGETNLITYGFVTARTTLPADSLSLGALHQAVLDVKNVYYLGLDGCGFNIGIEEIEEYQAQIYPNPVGQTLWISTTEPGDANISLYDMTGRVIHQSMKPSGETLVSLNLETLAPGVYTLLIHNSKTQRGFKLIKE